MALWPTSNSLSISFWIRLCYTFIWAVFKPHTEWSDAQRVNAPTTILLTTVVISYGFNCFGHRVYTPQTCTYRNIVKLLIQSCTFTRESWFNLQSLIQLEFAETYKSGWLKNGRGYVQNGKKVASLFSSALHSSFHVEESWQLRAEFNVCLNGTSIQVEKYQRTSILKSDGSLGRFN